MFNNLVACEGNHFRELNMTNDPTRSDVAINMNVESKAVRQTLDSSGNWTLKLADSTEKTVLAANATTLSLENGQILYNDSTGLLEINPPSSAPAKETQGLKVYGDLTATGAIKNGLGSAGISGQILTSGGPEKPWYWGNATNTGYISAVTGGTNISVDSTAPTNPVVNLDVQSDINMNGKNITNVSEISSQTNDLVVTGGPFIVLNSAAKANASLSLANRLIDKNGSAGESGQFLKSQGANGVTWSTLPPVNPGANIAVSYAFGSPTVGVNISETLDMNQNIIVNVPLIENSNGPLDFYTEDSINIAASSINANTPINANSGIKLSGGVYDSTGNVGISGEVLTALADGQVEWQSIVVPPGTILDGSDNYFLYRTSATSAATSNLLLFNAQGISSNVQLTAPQVTIQDDSDSTPSLFFSTNGVAKARIEYNGAGTFDSLNVSATDIVLDGTSGNLELANATGVRLIGENKPITILRQTGTPLVSDTQLRLNPAGNVQIGNVGLSTTPSLSFVSSGNTDATLTYDTSNNEIDINRKINVSGDIETSTKLTARGTAPSLNLVSGTNVAATLAYDTTNNKIDVNRKLNVAADIQTSTKVVVQGTTPEYQFYDIGGNYAAGLSFTDATNQTVLYGSGDVEIQPANNMTINTANGSFTYKNNSVQNFYVSGGGNTMRLNAPTGGQIVEINTAASSQQSEIKFSYGAVGAATAGFGIYRPTLTRSLAFYNYALSRNQLRLDEAGSTQFVGLSGNTVASISDKGVTVLGTAATGSGAGMLTINNTENTQGSGSIVFTKNINGGSTSTNTELGYIDFRGYDSSLSTRGAMIISRQEGVTAGGNFVPANLQFWTSFTSSGPAERMRIKPNGTICFGTSTAPQVPDVGTAPLLYAKTTYNAGWDGFTYIGGGTRGVVIGSYTAGGVQYAWVGAHSAALNSWENLTIAPGGNVGVGKDAPTVKLDVVGSIAATGTKPFKIPHPLPEKNKTHFLVHTAIEGPQVDCLYRGKVNLVNGKASVNIDEASGMTEGTFVSFLRDIQCFTSNESDWVHIRGRVEGNILFIEAQDPTATSLVSWMVIGERMDDGLRNTGVTDNDAKLIVEPLRPPESPPIDYPPV